MVKDKNATGFSVVLNQRDLIEPTKNSPTKKFKMMSPRRDFLNSLNESRFENINKDPI
jgi:hypothetical protein